MPNPMLDLVPQSMAAEQPRLLEFVLVAEHQLLDVGLRLWVGAIEVGFVGLSAGRVVFAELPGTTGDLAFQLLASLSDARTVPEQWTTRVTNIESEWRTLVHTRDVVEAGGRRARLATVRGALEAWIGSNVEVRELGSVNGRAQRAVVELLEWAAMIAYLDGSLARAELLLERRASVAATSLISQANLERIRMRRLEDEFEAKLAGGNE